MATHLEELALKKKKKKRITIIVILAVIACIIAGFLIRKAILASKDDTTVKIEVGRNQTLEYGQITSLIGNEMVYTVAERYTTEELQEALGSGNSMFPDMGNANASGDAFPAGGFGPASASADAFPTGGFGPASDTDVISPFGGDENSNPFGGNGNNSPFGGSASGDAGNSGNKSNKDDSNQVSYIYMATDTEVSVTIPVSVDVVTKLGTVTTFTRLAGGDTVGIVYETDNSGAKVIVRIYILQ